MFKVTWYPGIPNKWSHIHKYIYLVEDFKMSILIFKTEPRNLTNNNNNNNTT